MDPINPHHGLRCIADVSPFAIAARQEAVCCDNLSLAYSQVWAIRNTDCSCSEVPLGVSDWSAVRQAIPFSLLGASVSAVACERHPGACRVVSASSQHLPPQ